MGKKLTIRRLSYDDLRRTARTFLGKHHLTGDIPVPIEDMVEFGFGIDIIPMPSLQDGFDVVAWITSDLESIYVDEYVYKRRPTRYRFSLAHEIAHAVLHQKPFRELCFFSSEEWIEVRDSIDEEDHGWLEWQAYALAGLILVPEDHLKDRFVKACKKVEKAGLDLARPSDMVMLKIEQVVSKQFDVSREVIHKRLEKDRLWESL